MPAPAPRRITAHPTQIATILATIRLLESRGDYRAPPNRGRASGAYQFITSTWNGHAGYREAYLAPPEIQDERAAADVARFLAQWNNDVSMIPVMWYYPRAARQLELMDIVPVPSAGNVLTVREYQQRWLAVWATMSGRPLSPTGSAPGFVGARSLADQVARMGFAPEVPDDAPVDPASTTAQRLAHVAFPVLGPTRVAAPGCASSDTVAAGLCEQAAPGIAFGVKLQPVVAVTDGVVTDVHDVPDDPISVTITDDTGRSYLLAGFNDDNPGTDDGAAPAHLRLTALARIGETVRAGQIIGFMGDSSPLPLGVRSDVPTDRSVAIPLDAVAPHIRLTIVDIDGTAVDAHGPVVDAMFRQSCSVGLGPWSSIANGAGHTPVTVETTDDTDAIDSEWVITGTGEVNATGWAAMIYPSEACGWAPPDSRGPGAGGPDEVPSSWLTRIELPTPLWVDVAVRDTLSHATPMIRP